MAIGKSNTSIIDPADDVLLLGHDELDRHGHDLRLALSENPDCRAEVILAWLIEEVGAEAGYTRDCLLMAAGFVGELEQDDALDALAGTRSIH